MLMSTKAAGIGALTRLLVLKLIHSVPSFILVGEVRHGNRNDTTPPEFLQMLLLKLRRPSKYITVVL